MKVGIISDTHYLFDDKLRNFLKETDVILHAGDIGSLQIADEIARFKPLIAVYGNIDDAKVRSVYKLVEVFSLEGVKIVMTHIGGYPEHYNKQLKAIIEQENPDLVICGHSHILKIIYDKKYDHLHVNPGAAGVQGFHHVRTAIILEINGDKISELSIGEWQR